MSAIVYHNPRWSKSRESVMILDNNNITYKKINYIKEGISKPEVSNICKMLNLKPIDIIRTSDKNYKDLEIASMNLSDDDLINTIVKNPEILQRPIFINNNRTVIGRPPERVLEIL